MWTVNVLFSHEDEGRLLPVLDALVEKHGGILGVSGSEHQSWVFTSEAAAYAFAHEAVETCPDAVVIEPEQEE